MFVGPAPRRRCIRRGRRAAETERSLDETGVFKAAASGVRGRHRGAGRPRQLLIVIYFRWMWWCAIRINVGIGTSYKV
jgi:hypothetical protein